MKIELDSYATTIFSDCPRKYDLRINEHLVVKGSRDGRSIGSILHKGREVWRNNLMAGEAPTLALDRGITALENEYASTITNPLGLPPEKQLVCVRELFMGYTRKFLNQNYIPLAVEQRFKCFIGISPAGHEVWRTGIWDEVCRFNSNIYALDLKSSTYYPGADWAEGWRTNDQFMGYTWAAEQVYGQCHGAIAHGIWVHASPKTTRGKYKFEDYFTAHIVTFSHDQLEEWKRIVLLRTDQMIEAQNTNVYLPNWSSACKSYGGCDYAKWCGSTPSIRPQVEQIYYDRIVWTPMEEERLVTI